MGRKPPDLPTPRFRAAALVVILLAVNVGVVAFLADWHRKHAQGGAPSDFLNGPGVLLAIPLAVFDLVVLGRCWNLARGEHDEPDRTWAGGADPD